MKSFQSIWTLCSKAYSNKYYFIFHSSNLILFCDQMLDQVWSILPALELLPFDCSCRKGKQLQCRQNGSTLILPNAAIALLLKVERIRGCSTLFNEIKMFSSLHCENNEIPGSFTTVLTYVYLVQCITYKYIYIVSLYIYKQWLYLRNQIAFFISF